MRKIFKIFFATLLLVIIFCFSVDAANDSPASWAKENVGTMISAELIAPEMQNGYSANITRAEFSDVAVRVYEKAAKTNKSAKEIPDRFADIAATHYADSIKKAVAYGIASGVSNTEFAPENSITREQCAAMIYRMMKALGADISVGKVREITFADAAEQSSWAIEPIKYCAKAGLIRGTSSKNFNPSGKLTREQAYVIFYHVGRSCGFFRENTPISDYGELAAKDMCEENGKLYYMQSSYRWTDNTRTETEPFCELWCADSATGKVELYHKFNGDEFPKYPATDITYSLNLVAMDKENFYFVGGGIMAINRTSFQCSMFAGTEGVVCASANGDDLYFSRNNQLCKISFETGKIQTVLSFAEDVISDQMSIIGATVYITSRQQGERTRDLYRVDTDGSSVSYLGSDLFSHVYFHKDGIFAISIGFDDNGFSLLDQKIYEFGYGSQHMTYTKTEKVTSSSQVFDGILYRPYSDYGGYKVLKSKTGQILFSRSGNDNMDRRCGDYYYFYEDTLFYALNLRTSHAIQHYTDDARDYVDYYYKLAEKVKELVKPSMTDVEKAKAITDWICKTAEYDYPYYYGTANPPSPESGVALGLFYDGQIVCGGYADVTVRMFQLAGLDCYQATGKSTGGESHAWVHVKIDGKYYVVDDTWDDAREANQRYYRYFFIALENYPNKYIHSEFNDSDLSTIIFAEEDYPLPGINRDELYNIP